MKTMKKFIIAAALLLAGFATASAQKIKGSDTVLPLSQKEAEEYMKVNPSATVTVTGGGSGVGISALMEGKAMLSAKCRPETRSSCRSTYSPTTRRLSRLPGKKPTQSSAKFSQP